MTDHDHKERTGSDPSMALPHGWLPLMHEADLTRMCLSTGLNSLSNANHMAAGLYVQAFFNLSNGLERLIKLIYLIDHAMDRCGTYPTQGQLKSDLGHDLAKLFDKAVAIRARRSDAGASFQYELVDEVLDRRIISVLADFAERFGRYYNLDYLVRSTKLGKDPLAAWHSEVSDYLSKDYPERLRLKDEAWASDVEDVLGGISSVIQHTEDGHPIRNVTDSAMHTRKGEWIQMQATFHTATIVRYLCEVLRELNLRCLRDGVIDLPFLFEFFAPYNNPDRILKARKTFL